MIDVKAVKAGFQRVSAEIDSNKETLIYLDQQNGDGDLGISMSDGFRAVCGYLEQTEETRLAQVFSQAGNVFNEAAPSSLGTILSFFMKGMAKALKGKESCTTEELAAAMKAGLDNIMEKAGSKAGEKTILDSLVPAVEALEREKEGKDAWKAAAEAASAGCEATKNMRAVWGRAAYYGDASIGILDGGAYVGALIFKALSEEKQEGQEL